MRIWLRRLAPWLITGVIVVLLLRQYRISKIIEHLAQGHWLATLPWAFGLAIVFLVIVVACDRPVVRAVAPRPPRYLDLLAGKAAATMLLIVGYYASSGGYGVWLARKTGASAVRAAGIVLYVMTSDLVAICTVAGCAMAFGHLDVTPPRWLFILIAGIGIVQVTLILIAPLFRTMPEMLRAWHDVPRGTALLQIVGRCGNILLAVLASWAATRAFGLNVPFGAMAAYGPVILLAEALPINVAGFGAGQGAWLLLDKWAPGEQLLAFSFVWHLMIGAATLLRGLPFLRRAIIEIDRGVPEVKSRAVGGLG